MTDGKQNITNIVLYTLNGLGTDVSMHQLFKTLYFADQKHLVKYGSTILEDYYVAMNNGPVPSYLYDLFKEIRGDEKPTPLSTYMSDFIEISNYKLNTSKKANVDYLSESAIECLKEALEETKDLSFLQLTDKSHDEAWEGTRKNTKMDTLDIAKAGGADDAMQQYIKMKRENEQYLNDNLPW